MRNGSALNRASAFRSLVLLLFAFASAALFLPKASHADALKDEGPGLSVEGIKLFSGENGLEFWRLHANWGHLTQEGNDIDVDAPDVRYALGDPAKKDYLFVNAQKGRITEGQQHVRLWGDVTAVRGEEKAQGPSVSYDSRTRVMVFPDGASFSGPSGTAEMKMLEWELGAERLTGTGGVTVVIFPRTASAASSSGAAKK